MRRKSALRSGCCQRKIPAAWQRCWKGPQASRGSWWGQLGVEKRRSSPYRTCNCLLAGVTSAQHEAPSRRGCPPLFLWRAGRLREQAVWFGAYPSEKTVGGKVDRPQFKIKEIGYGQQ